MHYMHILGKLTCASNQRRSRPWLYKTQSALFSMFSQTYSSLDLHNVSVRIHSKVFGTNIKGCNLWLGSRDKYGYGVMRFPKTKHSDAANIQNSSVKVHRLLYFVENNGTNLTADMHVSHLCHSKACYRLEHLNYERPHVNADRNICHSMGVCHGHDEEPLCIV